MNFIDFWPHKTMTSGIDSFYYGATQTAFKFQTRAVSNCFNNGPAMLRYTFEMAWIMFTVPGINVEDYEYDLNDTLVRLVGMCNYFDTV